MTTYSELKTYFLSLVKFLDDQKEFDDILLTGKIMRTEKKESYWSTMTFIGYKTRQRKRGQATVYINLRDIGDRAKILQAVAHEANHIMPKTEEYYYNLLKFQNLQNS